MSRSIAKPAPATVRCAIYTRKSTEEGLQQEFNSLDAQRESAEAYIKSQQHEGWTCLPTHYDDGGYSGANVDRPALKRLLADIAAGKVDTVIVYKVDRLSRSLLDFGRIMETFDKHGVSFVSVTQAFNTTSSMGRLTLNILLSFAQFEREIISERTRDKMAAARKKGKYVGGAPLLGYDIDREASKLVVNGAEATQVRTVFGLYLEHESMLTVLAELNRRVWVTKRWTTRKGKDRGGRRFDRNSLYQLLTNVAYAGKVRYHDKVYDGQHEAIVDAATFERVQTLLRKNHRSGGVTRNASGALLRGLLRCVPCGCSMTHSHSTKGKTRYRYYVCNKAQRQGRQTCPSSSIPAPEIERFVVDQIRAIGRDPALVAATLAEARRQVDESLEALESERRSVEAELKLVADEMRAIAIAGKDVSRLADLHERVQSGERRLAEIADERDRLDYEVIDEDEAIDSLRRFDPVWDALTPREQARVLELLVERVDYHGADGTVSVTFRPTGIRALGEEFRLEEDAA
ncbi:MAG: recombinase family protein [Planctomycetaceae bacterium]|nr:recombinase family protein [Planctomycetaceae bacterium]